MSNDPVSACPMIPTVREGNSGRTIFGRGGSFVFIQQDYLPQGRSNSEAILFRVSIAFTDFPISG